MAAASRTSQHGSGRIVIVVGPGRSGTSSFAGTLERLGLHVPEPAIKPNPTNPAGFYEPRWVVDFHNRMLERAAVRVLDLSPQAIERSERTGAKPGVRAKLRGWLEDVLTNQANQLIVKDPRTTWFPKLWVDTAREFDIDPGFVTMLRHPAEVSSSRQTYYGKDTSGAQRRADDIARIGGWINVALVAERTSRGSARSFVRYTDLVADWRSTMKRVGDALDLTFDPALDVDPHPVDEFIDPSLHRIRVDWDDVDVPDSLRDVAERAWTVLSRLATEDPDDPTVLAEVDDVSADYTALYADATALSRHDAWRTRIDARRRASRASKGDDAS